MNNWRLLLLAVVVVVQPIGSFTESNLFDGHECCERSEDARLNGYRTTDERRSLDGNREDRRRTNEERRLKSLQGIRKERRYETIRGPMLTLSESLERSERRTSPELSRFTELRLTREQEPLARTKQTREDQNRNQNEFRNVLGKNKRASVESRNRENLDATRTIRVSRNARDTRSIEHESSKAISRLQIRNSRSTENHRVSPNRGTTALKRELEGIAQHDSRITTPATLDSGIQFGNNRERTLRVYSLRTQDESTEFRQPRISNARFNGFRVAQTQRSVEQAETNSRYSKVVRIELERHQRNTEIRDRVSTVRRRSERISAETMREPRDENARPAQEIIEIRNNERINEHKQQHDENRYSMDSQRNTAERRLGARQTRASRSLDMNLSDGQVERRLHPMLHESIRLSRASKRNTRNEKAARIQVMRDESLAKRRQEPFNNRISRDGTNESRRIANRMDISESSEEQRQQREVKGIEQSQETRTTPTRRDIRESSVDRKQVNRLSRDRTISALREVRDTERVRESTRTVRENPEERMLQRENNRLSRGKTISILREVRDNTEQESRDESSEFRQRVNNRFLSNIISTLREDREARGSTERAREPRRVVSPSRTEVNFRKLDSRNRQEVQDRERSDLRRQVVQKSITNPRVTRSISVERRNYARATSRASRSAEASRIREDTRINERYERQRLERLNVPNVRNYVEIRETERREKQREVRDDDRTRIPTNRRSNERESERTQDQDSSEESRKVQMTRNQDAVRDERTLAERRQENRDAEDSRFVRRAARNLAGVRSERVIAERRSENRGPRNARREIMMEDKLDSRLQLDATRDLRETSSQRESRYAERFNARSRDSITISEPRNARGIRNNERHIRNERNFNTDDDRREFKSVQSEKEESRFANGRSEETRFRDIDSAAPDTVQDSDEPVSNWQMVFYTLQGVYLCGLLIQMLKENANKSKKRTFNWWSSSKNLIKVD